MTYQWVGATMVIAGCGGLGFTLASGYRREMHLLSQLQKILNEMEWELQYRLTPVPELCRITAADTSGVLQEIFYNLHEVLFLREQPDVRSAMAHVLSEKRIPKRIRKHLQYLGASLGRYDLQGQVQGLRSVKESCLRDLNELEKGKAERMRNYQTLALCAGAGIAILFL